MGNKVHIGRNIKRVREILGIKKEVLAIELNMSYQNVSQLEKRETIEPDLLEQIAGVLNVPVEAIWNFDDTVAINIFSTTFNSHDDSTSPAYKPAFNVDVFGKWLEAMDEIKHLYATLLNSEREKVSMLEKMLGIQ